LQVHVASAQGSSVKALTDAPLGVQQFAWSPDGKAIAYATADEPEKKAGFERFNDSFEVAINDNFLMTAAPTSTHIWTVPSSGGENRRLTSGAWSLPVTRPPGSPSSMIVWTPDGKSIAFARNASPRGGGGGGLQLVSVDDGAVTPLNNLNGTFPIYSPAGGNIAYMGGGGVSVAPISGGAGRNLTQAIDRGMARALWMPDGKSLIVGANDSVRVSLWQQPLEGAAVKLDLGDASPNSSFFVDMNISRTGAIAFAGSASSRPAELYYMASPTSQVKALTKVNAAIAELPLGRTEVIEWASDRFQANGMLTLPPDFSPSQKYPLVLLIHGGPRAASLLNFSAGAQLMAAKGWIVFQPNYRGSDNLGREFQGAIQGDAGAGPGRDVMAGIETIKSRGIVDEGRIAVSGWSYGGYMTVWMLGHYDIWKCGVAGAPVTDQLDQQTISDGARGGGANSPLLNEQAMQRVREQSPITYANKIKAPTLIMHNTGDYRVTINQAYKLFHALRDNNVETQFIAYPIYGHNATDPVRQRDVQRRWIGWIEKHFGPANAGGGGR